MKSITQPLFYDVKRLMRYDIDENGLFMNDKYNQMGFSSPYLYVESRNNTNHHPSISLINKGREELLSNIPYKYHQYLPDEINKDSGNCKFLISGKYTELEAAVISQYIKLQDITALHSYLIDRYFNNIEINIEYWKEIIGSSYFEFQYEKYVRGSNQNIPQRMPKEQVKKLANKIKNQKTFKDKMEVKLSNFLNVDIDVIKKRCNVCKYLKSPSSVQFKDLSMLEWSNIREKLLEA